jgi:hypothetical protein
MKTYTSPHTGITYEVKVTEEWYTEFCESGSYKVGRDAYNFYRDGRLVTLTFTMAKQYLNDHFGVVEGVYQILTSPRD